MEAREFKQGNYLNYAGQTVIVLEIKRNETLELGYYSDSVGFERKTNDVWLKPIPITKDWLLRFGFTYNNDYKTYGLFDYCISIKDNEFHFMNDPISDAGCYYLKTIKYIHQLQNLYFALTGEELTPRS